MIDPATQYTPLEATQCRQRNARTLSGPLKNRMISQNLLIFGNIRYWQDIFIQLCVAKELLDQGHSVIYFSAHQLFELLTDEQFLDEPQIFLQQTIGTFLTVTC